MKKLIFVSFCLCLFEGMLFSQNIWGTTRNGGKGFGTIYELNSTVDTINYQYQFNGESGQQFVKHSNGKFYGTSVGSDNGAGNGDVGGIVVYDPITNISQTVFNFSALNSDPIGQHPILLLEASNGKIYGNTQYGSDNGDGCLFEFDPLDNSVTKIAAYNRNTGSSPTNSELTLQRSTDGKIYMIMSGGMYTYDYNSNTFFELYPLSVNHHIISIKQSVDGSIFGSDNGDRMNANYGEVIFSMESGTTINTSFIIGGDEGENPRDFFKYQNFEHFGIAQYGGNNNGGTIFRYVYTPDPMIADTLEDVIQFDDLIFKGKNPIEMLLYNDNLIGITQFGGIANAGVLFKYNITTKTYSVLHEFDNSASSCVITEDYTYLKLDNNVLFFNATYQNEEALMEYDLISNTLIVKKVFKDEKGKFPMGGLTLASNGKFYGVAEKGGVQFHSTINKYSQGVIFEFDPITKVYSVKYEFDSIQGSNPKAKLFEASNGKLYGTTYEGGQYNDGVIFSYDYVNNIFTKIHDFKYFGTSVLKAKNPKIEFIEPVDGKLYGIIDQYIYTVSLSNNLVMPIYQFVAMNGWYPKGNMYKASNGKMYGVTSDGTADANGGIYEFDLTTNILTRKLNFTNATGYFDTYTESHGTFVELNNKLYLPTAKDYLALGNGGALLEYDYTNNSVQVVADFWTSFGLSLSEGQLLVGNDGNLYGTARSVPGTLWSTSQFGAIYKFDLSTSVLSKVMDFTGENGSYVPGHNHLTYYCPKPSNPQNFNIASNTVCYGTTNLLLSIDSIDRATTYSWTPPNGANIIGNQLNDTILIDVSGLSAGPYTIQVRGENTCGSGFSKTLNISIVNPITRNQNIVICQGDSYTVGTNNYTTTGTYTDLLTASSGCDSTVITNLIVNANDVTSQTVNACGSYFWTATNSNYTNSGVYIATLQNQFGCDSTITLNLTINQATSSTQNITMCDTYTWSVNGQTYSQSGIYFATIPNSNNCDSIITLNLTIVNSSSSVQQITSCGSYLWTLNNQTYTSSGNYSYVLTNADGCDSIVNLALTIITPFNITENVNACSSYIWSVNNQIYSNSGTYMEIFQDVNGCDSTYILNLIISNPTSSTFNETACSSYTWALSNQTYTSSGTYSFTTDGSNGCDSIVNLNLTIFNPSITSFNQIACSSYTWAVNNQTYSNSGTYTENFTDSHGCDSTVILNLSIEDIDATVQVLDDTTLMVPLVSGLTYLWFNCETGDEAVGATFNTFSPPSVAQFYVVINSANCVDTSICVSILDLTSLNDISNEISVDLFPNPTNDIMHIKSDFLIDKVSILDMKGIVINVLDKNVDIIDLGDLSKGVYYLIIESNAYKINRKIVVE